MSPSQDRVDPKANEWLKDRGSSDPEKPLATGSSKSEPRAMSGHVQRLARRLRKDPDALASQIPPDTIRRTKYPVIEVVNEDGTRSYKHDPGIAEGVKSQFRP